jgi:hypothetical protein
MPLPRAYAWSPLSSEDETNRIERRLAGDAGIARKSGRWWRSRSGGGSAQVPPARA